MEQWGPGAHHTYHSAPARGIARVRTRRRKVAHAKAGSALLGQSASVDDVLLTRVLCQLAEFSGVQVLLLVDNTLHVNVLPIVEVRQLDDWVVKAIPIVAVHAAGLCVGYAEVPKIIVAEKLTAIQVTHVPTRKLELSLATVEISLTISARRCPHRQDALIGNVRVLCHTRSACDTTAEDVRSGS